MISASGSRTTAERLDPDPDSRILILGCGTGQALNYLPSRASVTAVDLVPSMVQRTAARGANQDVSVGIADAHTLPYDDDTFDAVLLHLVLSVVPDPGAVVAETERVLTPDGRVSIYDKFSPEDGDPALARRAANLVARLLFTDLNRPLEPMVDATLLTVSRREPFLGGLYTVAVAHSTADSYIEYISRTRFAVSTITYTEISPSTRTVVPLRIAH